MYYFLNYKALISDHTSGQFSDKDAISYLLLFYLEGAVYKIFLPEFQKSAYAERSLGIIVIALAFAAIFTLILRTVLRWWWQANGGERSQKFLNRLISLCWVFQFRTSLVILPLTILLKLNSDAQDTSFVLIMSAILGVAVLASLFYIVHNVKRSLQEIYGASRSQDENL